MGTSWKTSAAVGAVVRAGSTLYQPSALWQPACDSTSVPVKPHVGENTAGTWSASVFSSSASWSVSNSVCTCVSLPTDAFVGTTVPSGSVTLARALVPARTITVMIVRKANEDPRPSK